MHDWQTSANTRLTPNKTQPANGKKVKKIEKIVKSFH